MCVGLLAVLAALGAQTAPPPESPQPQQPPEPVPATRPAPPETAQQRLNHLLRSAPSSLSRDELALAAGLDFFLAIARADARTAAERLDATGYQPLPLRGPLADEPGRPLTPQAVKIRVGQQSPAPLGDAAAARFSVRRAPDVADPFPGVSRWMLPDDFCIVYEPAGRIPNWTDQPCCVVVRVRAQRAVVMGGNLLAALETAP